MFGNFLQLATLNYPAMVLGGTVKRLTAQARLEPPVTNQTLSAKDIMKFCEESINGIKFVYTLSEAIVNVRNVLINRCTLAKTIPVPRSYH